MKRLLVTGSRRWTDVVTMRKELVKAWVELGREVDTVLVHGAARGADRMAKAFWRELGLVDEPHPANWEELGHEAGPIRNQEMVDLGADLCLAFPTALSKGTYHCVRRAKAAGIPVRMVESRVRPS